MAKKKPVGIVDGIINWVLTEIFVTIGLIFVFCQIVSCVDSILIAMASLY